MRSILRSIASAALCVGLVTAAAAPALAQDESVTAVARSRYADGVKAYDAGKFEDARSAFLQAYALTRHPAVLLNIGQAELRSNHIEDAGNHLQQFLREHTAATPDQRASAEKGIAEAKKKAASIVVSVDASGAEVSIDGTSIGKSPIADAFFVRAGKHTVVAQLNGKTAAQAVDAKVGVPSTATLSFGTGVAPVPTPVPTPPSNPVPVPGPGPSGPPVVDQPQPPFGSGYAPTPTPMPPGPIADDGTGQRQPFFDWYKQKPVAWVGTGMIGLGLIGGIVFGASAGSASTTASNHADEIAKHLAANPGDNPTGRSPCGARDGSTADLKGYEKACGALRTDLSAYDTDSALATTSWIVFGVGAVGTITYALVDWYPKKTQKTAILAPRVLGVAPTLTPQQRGIGVVGEF
jgi:hypothetical protein